MMFVLFFVLFLWWDYSYTRANNLKIEYINLIFSCVYFFLYFSFWSFPVNANHFIEYFCKWFASFLLAEAVQLLDITWAPIVNIDLQQFPQIPKGAKVWRLTRPKKNINFPIFNSFHHQLDSRLGIFVNLKHKDSTISQKKNRFEEVFFIHPAINVFQFSGTFCRKTPIHDEAATKHHAVGMVFWLLDADPSFRHTRVA